MGFLGLVLLTFRPIAATPPGRLAVAIFTAIFWITLPLFFFWMYLCNSGNTVWLASMSAMFLIYYHLTDWRLATVGSASGLLAAWLLFQVFGPRGSDFSEEEIATHAVVFAFSWCMGLVLGISSSSLRREQLTHTLATMGIMAHELRTPLATMSLIGDAVRGDIGPADESHKREKLAARLHALVRNMNHQIDTQIANAQLMHLPGTKEAISAAELVREAVAGYPYRSSRERESVVVQVRHDFYFKGSRALFSQMIDNLMKNALRSLAAANRPSRPGDLLLEVGTLQSRGRIVITDRGVGIAPELQLRIFEPFFSTSSGTGHGLGLAFCKRVVESAHGSIHVRSEPARGAAFTIELPQLR